MHTYFYTYSTFNYLFINEFEILKKIVDNQRVRFIDKLKNFIVIIIIRDKIEMIIFVKLNNNYALT